MANKVECCGSCKYWHLLKEIGKDNRSVCTVLTQTEKGYDAFALVCESDGSCEMWEDKND